SAGENVARDERVEAADLFVTLAESYDGEHGLAYSLAALDADAGHDRAMQLAGHYAAALGRSAELPTRWAASLAANPRGALADDAKRESAGVAAPAPAAAPASPGSAAEAPAPSRDAARELADLGAMDKIPRLLESASSAAQKGNKPQALAQ